MSTEQETRNINDYLHLHMGAPAHVEIDGQVHSASYITRSLLFDQLEQKKEYGRDMTITPMLRPLADITQEELDQLKINKTNKLLKSDINFNTWHCFTPDNMVQLLKQFDLFGLIKAGLAIDKTTMSKKYPAAAGSQQEQGQ